MSNFPRVPRRSVDAELLLLGAAEDHRGIDAATKSIRRGRAVHRGASLAEGLSQDGNTTGLRPHGMERRKIVFWAVWLALVIAGGLIWQTIRHGSTLPKRGAAPADLNPPAWQPGAIT